MAVIVGMVTRRAASAAVVAVLAMASVSAVAQTTRPGANISPTRGSLPTDVTVTEWATGLEHPWGLALLPDGGALVTERPGRMRVVSAAGRLSAPVAGLPKVAAGGQGGLLDVVLDPGFADNRTIYFSYSEPGESAGTNSTAVARARLVAQGETWALDDVEVIFRQAPKYASTAHFGSRLLVDDKGHLYVTLGDRSSRRDDAQTLDQHHGKIVRIATDGSVPGDNPFVGRKDARPEIWSFGHRNIQGAAWHPATGAVWIHEHGPQGGDEINVVERGKNYGWPKYTYGENYGGGRIGEEASPPGFVAPHYTWVPSIGPSGMAFYPSDRIPAWKGSLFVGGLRERALVRLSMQGEQVVAEERLLTDRGDRVRDVRAGNDGALYVLTDSAQGKLLRIAPASTAR